MKKNIVSKRELTRTQRRELEREVKRNRHKRVIKLAATGLIISTTITTANPQMIFAAEMPTITQSEGILNKSDIDQRVIDTILGNPTTINTNPKDPSLVDVNRQYFGNEIINIFNAGPFDFVRMKDLKNSGKQFENLDYVKAIAIHETDNWRKTSWAVNNYNYFKNPVNEALTTFTVDSKTIVQNCSLWDKAWAVGDNLGLKEKIYGNDNTVSIEIAVNNGSDYRKAVANAIYLVRILNTILPNVNIVPGDDSGLINHNIASNKDCPHLMRLGTVGYTWDEFKHYASNSDLPIPYINGSGTTLQVDYHTIINSAGNEVDIYDDSRLLDENGNAVTDLAVVDTSKKVKPASEDSAKKEDVSESTNDENTNKTDISNGLEKSNDLEKPSLLKRMFSNESKNKTENSTESKDIYSDIKFNYQDFDIDKNLELIKASSPKLAYDESQIKKILETVDYVCRLEDFNPNVTTQLMNGYTGYLSFQGKVKSDMYNFGALKDSNGEYINCGSAIEGVITFVHYLKALTSKDKTTPTIFENSAVKTISEKGIVKNFGDFKDTLGVSNEFLDSVATRINNL